MEENERDIFLHNWIIEEIQTQYLKEFNEIKVNRFEENNNDIDGVYPDIIFGNYGQVVMLGEVEVNSTINNDSIQRWKNTLSLNINLLILVPKSKLKKVRDMCWENKLIEKVKVSGYSVDIPIK